MSLLSALGKGTYQTAAQTAQSAGQTLKSAYVPDVMGAIYNAGIFGQLLRNIRDNYKSQKKDTEKTNKILEKQHIDNQSLYTEMLKRLESIDRSMKLAAKNGMGGKGPGHGPGYAGQQGTNADHPLIKKGEMGMGSMLLDFIKNNPGTSLLAGGGIGLMLKKAWDKVSGNKGGNGKDGEGLGLRNNPITSALTDIVTGYAAYRVGKFGLGTAIKAGTQAWAARRGTMSAMESMGLTKEAIQNISNMGTMGAPANMASTVANRGAQFEEVYKANRAAGMSPAQARNAAGLQTQGTNFGVHATKEAAMNAARPPLSATPTLGERAAGFGSKALGVGKTALKWGGRLLGGIGVGMQGYDTYEKIKEGDTLGAWISGLSTATGVAGLGLAATGIGAPVGAALMGTSALLSGVGMARDWLRGPAPQQAEPVQQPTPAATAPAKKVEQQNNGNTSYGSPLDVGTVSRGSQRHGYPALDIAAPEGTPIKAIEAGEVLSVVPEGSSGGYGNLIKIRHANGQISLYGHLSAFNVKQGDKVEKGKVIGKVGSTGKSTGPHLHLEVQENGRKIQPEGLVPLPSNQAPPAVNTSSLSGTLNEVADAVSGLSGKNADGSTMAGSEIMRLVDFLKEGIQNAGNPNYNIDQRTQIFQTGQQQTAAPRSAPAVVKS